MSDRLTLCLPVDVFQTQFDSTVTQTQIGNNTVLGSTDDREVLSALIEDAEDEFRTQSDMNVRLSRSGSPGDKTTYDEITYKLPGHENFKNQWSGVGGDYLNESVETDLKHDRVLPFDSAEGDEAYIYRGLGNDTYQDGWEDVTDERGETWDIIDHRHGTLLVSALEIDRAMRGHTAHGIGFSRQNKFRMKVTYRYGTLGGDRGSAGQTTLTESITQAESVPFTKGVTDASLLPTTGGGSVILLVNSEYFRATVDAANDQITVEQRQLRNTSASAHATDDRVAYTPPAIRKAVAARAGMALIQTGRYQSYLPDADDAIDKGEMLDEMKATWDTTLTSLS